MPSKVQLYAQMADRTAEQITGSYQKWTAFLTTAARLYKYPYNEQLMIFAQRPEATACAEYDLWNKQMRRYVRRGSKGIALVDTSSDQPKLRYVFDVSDNDVENSVLARIFCRKLFFRKGKMNLGKAMPTSPLYSAYLLFISPDMSPEMLS